MPYPTSKQPCSYEVGGAERETFKAETQAQSASDDATVTRRPRWVDTASDESTTSGPLSPSGWFDVSEHCCDSSDGLAPRIGIDIGGVIIADGPGDDDTFFSQDYLATPEVPGAFDSIAELATWATCFIVSKVGSAKEKRCRQWLFARRFPDRCAIPPDRWHFSASRADKGPIASRLRLDGFVDDHVEVLDAMPSSVRCRVLFGSHLLAPEHMALAPDWPTALRVLTSQLRLE